MRLGTALFWFALWGAGACFVDSTGGGGGVPKDTTSVFLSGGFGQGGSPSGGGGAGGSTVSGLGGAGQCGDGTPSVGEECDDGNLASGDGCDPACQAEPMGDCPAMAVAFLGQLGDALDVSGNTTGANDTLRLGEGGSCKSDGPDQWLAVQMLVSGTVEAHLVVKSGFGGNHDKAVLHVRRGCQPDLYSDELACLGTNGSTPGEAEIGFFARAGETIYFAVDGSGAGDDGTYDLVAKLGSVCGDGNVGGIEQCDDETAACSGCMRVDLACGGGLGNGTYDGTSGHCYVASEGSPVAFWGARQRCFEAGGDLFSLDPNDGALPAQVGDVWVGLADFVTTDMLDEFRWLGSGGVGTLTTMDDPANALRCVNRTPAAQLFDRACDQALGVLCEIALDNP
jgi:cysteine-rich repeat protein